MEIRQNNKDIINNIELEMVRVVVQDYQLDPQCAENCPVAAIIKNPQGDEYVVNPQKCIDCGVCQAICTKGTVTTIEEATEEDIQYNETKAIEWDQ